jgi:hypothetical protein
MRAQGIRQHADDAGTYALPLLWFLCKKGSHRPLVRWTLERVNKIPEPFREELRPKRPVRSDTWRGNIMPEKPVPAVPELFIHQPINVMRMNCLERFQELVGRVEKSRTFFNG